MKNTKPDKKVKMSLLKLSTAVVLAFSATGLFGAAALAADPTPAPSAPSFGGEREDENEDHGSQIRQPAGLSERERHEQEERHHELEQRYGDIDQVSLPPLVISKDGTANPPTSSLNTSGQGFAGKPLGVDANGNPISEGRNGLNPNHNEPLDVSTAVSGRKTPADVFFEGATVGLGLMGAAAVTLGGVAVVRNRRLRNNPEADFIYDSTK